MSAPRRPAAATPARIAPLATLPLFHKLAGRKVVLAGASEGALWKAELLLAAGADLLVLAGDEADRFAALAQDPPSGRATVLAREWLPEDLDGAAFAVADVDSDAEARRFVEAARAAGALVNVVDRPAFCDAQFGALVNRSPLVVAISTDGAAPVFGQAIRARIEALLPRGLAGWAQAARDWRPAVQARDLPFRARRAFWERFTARAMAAPERTPDAGDRDALFGQLATFDGGMAPRGQVTLVGVGPGDPDLLTLKAIRVLQSADVILHDDLVSPEILELARREATRMLVGKTGHGPSCRQCDINDLMVRLARQGRHVARLKSGDPAIFGRATEEIEACDAAGIPVSIVPGITAAQGAAAALRFSLTQRAHARRLQFVTGHAQDGELPGDLSFAALADPSVTTVVYMPRRTWAGLAAKAIAAGLDPDMPALAVTSATRKNQREVLASVSTLAARLDDGSQSDPSQSGPMLIMIGRSVAAAAGAMGARDEAQPHRAGDDAAIAA